MSRQNTFTLRLLGAALVSTALAIAVPLSSLAKSYDDEETIALLQALNNSKVSMAEAIQQLTKGSETAISAKYELDDSKRLSLSVYTAEKGLGEDTEHNVLKEFSGSPEKASWTPEAEVFKDIPHVSRASGQLTLIALAKHSLVDLGDIVLLENEVNPVMSAALDNGLEVTALHNHFLWDSPKVMFMHIGGMGDQEALAQAVGRVFGKVKEVISTKPSMPAANVDPAKTSFDPEDIEQILGTAGVLNNGVYKVVIGRTAKMGEHEVGKEMGINTWAAFAGSEQQAVVDGDIAMLEGEVQSVLKALRRANINIVAIHNHMIGELPRYVFLHYWGVGPAEDLAKGLKAALATQSGN